MVSMKESSTGATAASIVTNGVVLPTKYFILLIGTLTVLISLQVKSFVVSKEKETEASHDHHIHKLSSPIYHESQPVLRSPKDHEQCRFYLAESAVAPGAGMGMFTATGLLQDDMIGFPDICIFVSDAPKKWTHLRSHSWGWGNFFGQYEGGNSRAACEGYATIFNTMPDTHINTRLVSPVQQTTAGVKRDKDPAAGSLTHHYGIHSVALDVIAAGSELTINYGDWDFAENKEYKRPSRTPDWLAENGWCIDHIEIAQSTIPGIGRGAFVKRNLEVGTVIAPAPLQMFKDRAIFQQTNPEQLYVNYCIQPSNSHMLMFPYGPGVNLINHSSEHPNVRLQWSTNYMHKKELLDMSYDEFWENVNPGSLVLEVVALHDLETGEELFLDYGPAWETAWEEHVAKWEPLPHAEDYVYPEDMDPTEMLRTVEEQKDNPYPKNLITMCFTPEWERDNVTHVEWYEPEWDWSQGLVFCNILERQMGDDGNYEYTVSLNFFEVDVSEPLIEEEIAYDPSVPYEDLYIDTRVPRRAIRWIEKPYLDDEHLSNAFRHPIGLPDELVPDAWRTDQPI